MKDSAISIAFFTFSGVFCQAFFNYLGSQKARQHEINLLRLKKELEDDEEAHHESEANKE